ncbi:hypothetical protein AAFF_G00303500 [Aldrovandia affinis]|uniref:Uncharacterized protein n=1 Tax=Aldrovandia affinis TaxID=143900 RepID=A0AAD7W1E7_9TELE|nr:hypothetical protein AAFF_G00303500 [Aldrovandia affinis]
MRTVFEPRGFRQYPISPRNPRGFGVRKSRINSERAPRRSTDPPIHRVTFERDGEREFSPSTQRKACGSATAFALHLTLVKTSGSEWLKKAFLFRLHLRDPAGSVARYISKVGVLTRRAAAERTWEFACADSGRGPLV